MDERVARGRLAWALLIVAVIAGLGVLFGLAYIIDRIWRSI
jgi:hypothetical protein